ncbi:ABC transporter ATP-binding protein (plasmid) [Staphylococcus epidermidis]|uniref:ABC transporter ATP-binding protein n=1 Tax=Staphylococcus TaxID=1279 RepID=UPI0005FB42A4|nr:MULTISPECIES: ABC transporter ATP-binding protein [Staphylococcus]AYY61004.1 ABC transporter ATP-binding protein [Staphylococcus epidermidis]MBM5966149.1 ABC transporter ATP-binding protein [Staphylococcus epidermidis]MBM5999359.1 ABC transporter ATP-binding protein [Staphylococcus epidermidis]MCG1178745.1 ABC transporter ATP-binding protein/permease [Staphylococcus epidermidis]MCG1180977.1 ABC transporter ATP-binding protein/permease [Staphylococcus epidermidis]
MKQKNPVLHLVNEIEIPKWLLFFSVLLSVIGSIFQLIVPLFTQNIVDNFSEVIKNKYYIIVFVFIFLLSSILNGLSIYLLTKLGENIIYSLTNKVWNHILRLKTSFFDKNSNGELLSRIIDDTKSINSFITEIIPSFFPSIIVLFGSIFFLFMLDWETALIALISIPMYVILIIPISNVMQKLSYKTQLETAKVSGVIAHVLSKIKLVKLSNSINKEFRQTNSYLRNIYYLGVKEGVINSIVVPLSTLIMLVSMGGVLGFGGYRVASGAISPGTLIALIFYMTQLTDPIEKISSLFTGYKKTIGASQRLSEILSEEKENLQNNNLNILNSVDLSFNNVSFSYDESNHVFTNLSFTIPKNKITAIVGPSGSGKTTILNLISRLYEIQSGSIKYGTNSIYDYSLINWRKNLGYVMQNSGVLNRTVKSNITYSLQETPCIEDIIYYSKLASTHDFIMKLPNDYNTLIGEKGINLSGGEKQRLDIARNFIKTPGILLLDEATSNLDSESEHKIQESIKNVSNDRTTIIVAHRLSTVLKADKIIFIDNGEITGMGTHAELLSRHSKYKNMIELQQLK